MMRIFYAILFSLGPRLVCALYWFSNSEFVVRVFNGWVWPLLGGIFLPWTTLVYVVAHTSYDQTFAGWDWLWLGVAFAVDMITNASVVYYRVKRENALDPLQWIERSRALRIFLYLVMIAVGILPALFMVAALIGDGAINPGFWVQFLTLIFLVYLFLGFVFCFVDPDLPWIPALLLNAPAILLGVFFDPGLFVIVVWAAGAATLGAYLGGLLLKRGKKKEAPGGLRKGPLET